MRLSRILEIKKKLEALDEQLKILATVNVNIRAFYPTAYVDDSVEIDVDPYKLWLMVEEKRAKLVTELTEAGVEL